MASNDEEEDTVQWSVMGVVSCIPLINWTVGAPRNARAAGHVGPRHSYPDRRPAL